ncbi:hypothetical protein BJV77DRAFT_328155 [Russula vinacea]|nr:hypothetical protein BJV77DRAFT_328155 [Russula vinacea]
MIARWRLLFSTRTAVHCFSCLNSAKRVPLRAVNFSSFYFEALHGASSGSVVQGPHKTNQKTKCLDNPPRHNMPPITLSLLAAAATISAVYSYFSGKSTDDDKPGSSSASSSGPTPGSRRRTHHLPLTILAAKPPPESHVL